METLNMKNKGKNKGKAQQKKIFQMIFIQGLYERNHQEYFSLKKKIEMK